MQPIVKFSLLKRRPDLTWQEYSQHWRETHARVLVDAGHAEYNASYVQNHFEPLDPTAADDLLFDGAAQMRQKSERNISAGFQEDPRYLQYVRPDEDKFMDVSRSMVLFTRAVPLKPGAGGAFKVMSFISSGDSTPAAAQALDDWQTAQFAAKPELAERVLACTHFHALEGAVRGLVTTDFDDSNPPPARFDAVSEVRFATMDDLRASLASLEAPPGTTFRVISREVPIHGV